MFKKLCFFCLSFLISAQAHAAIVFLDVTGSWTASDYDVSSTGPDAPLGIAEENDDLVFGTAPSDGSTTFRLRVDTSSAVSFASGYDNGGFLLTHDWYGYSDVSLVGTHSFGSASWETADILTGLIGVDNLGKALWTDTDISAADPTLLSFRMQGDWEGTTADMFIGPRTNTTIGNEFLLWEYFAGEEIRSNSYSATASVVPVPAAVWLFGTALVGLVGFSRRRKAA